MHLHYKNIKSLCSASRTWGKKYLSYLGIDRFSCNFLDLKHNTYLPLGSRFDRYCSFIEQKLHHDFASRVTPEIRYWDTGENLYDIEQAHYQTESASEGLSPTPHAFDWTMKTDTGFEIFCVVSHQPLQPSHMQALDRKSVV